MTLVRVATTEAAGSPAASVFTDQAAHYTSPALAGAQAPQAPVASQVSAAAPMGPDAQFPTKITLLQWSPDGTRLLTGDSVSDLQPTFGIKRSVCALESEGALATTITSSPSPLFPPLCSLVLSYYGVLNLAVVIP